jgi:hypothetical protein
VKDRYYLMLSSLKMLGGFLAAVACIAFGGCGSGDMRQAVSGKVTLDGVPLTQGSVVFEPTEANGGPLVGTTITDGEFSIARAKGVQPGKYLLMVSAVRPTGRKLQAFGRNIDEAAPAAIKEMEGVPTTVVAGEPNRFEVNVHSQKR